MLFYVGWNLKTKKSVKEQRKAILEKMFGIDKGLKPFTEEDRGEDRD
jgi:hypothetical protein